MSEKDLNLVSYICLAVIVVAFIICLLYVIIEDKKGKMTSKRRWMDQIPSLVSTLGVLGTFFGITVGLINFDTLDLDNSIPLLLAGLKTAFFTSLAGMVGSLILSRIVIKKFDEKDQAHSEIDVAAGRICEAVQALQQQSNEQNGLQRNFFTAAGLKLNEIGNYLNTISTKLDITQTTASSIYKTAISINSSLADVHPLIDSVNQTVIRQQNAISDVISHATDIKRALEILPDVKSDIEEANRNIAEKVEGTKSDIGNKINDLVKQGDNSNAMLIEKFDGFSVLLKESNTNALVEVMKGVSDEFERQMSTLINRLVQENFGQLNQSVEKLNQWQVENKQMVEDLTKKYQEMERSFTKTSTVLSKVSEDTNSLVGNGGKLGALVETLKNVMVDDTRFVEISDNLKSAAELTKGNMDEFKKSTDSLQEWVKKQKGFVDGVNNLINKLDELNNIRDYGNKFWGETKKSLNDCVDVIKGGAISLNNQLTQLDERFYNRLSATLAELDTCIQSMVRGNN